MSILNDCIITNNAARDAYGGGVFSSTVTNCLIAANQALDGGGAAYCGLFNCTVASNSASSGSGTYLGSNYNCIIYGNHSANYVSGTFANCDTTPLPSGTGNITNDPVLVNLPGGNYHLQSTSPCINSGNNTYIAFTNDLDGNSRIVGGTVDIGCYEYQTLASVISYAWLQEYGLPTDGSADSQDLDGTGFTVDQDWIAGLNPTNSASVLAMLPPGAINNTAGITVRWQSVSGIPYILQRSTNLFRSPVFSTIQTNIVGQAGTTTYLDTAATNNGPYYYRVGAQ